MTFLSLLYQNDIVVIVISEWHFCHCYIRMTFLSLLYQNELVGMLWHKSLCSTPYVMYIGSSLIFTLCNFCYILCHVLCSSLHYVKDLCPVACLYVTYLCSILYCIAMFHPRSHVYVSPYVTYLCSFNTFSIACFWTFQI